MKIEQQILDRLNELIAMGERVAKTRQSRSGPGFVSLGDHAVNYELAHQWGTSCLSIFNRVFGSDSDYYKKFDGLFAEFHNYAPVIKALGILRAANEDYEGGYLFTVRGLVTAEVSTDVLEQSRELLRAGYKDPACVVAGVVLEISLKELCTRNAIPHAKLDAMNVELCKKGVYNMGMQKQITAWAHWRNKAAHGDWHEYNNADVEDMIKGVARFLAEYV